MCTAAAAPGRARLGAGRVVRERRRRPCGRPAGVSPGDTTPGCAIVKRMSANGPRPRRSRMWRSVSSFDSAGDAPTTSMPSSSPARLNSAWVTKFTVAPPNAGYDRGREGRSDPRGRRPRGPAVRGRRGSAAGPGEILVELKAAAQPPRPLDPARPAVRSQAAHPRRRRGGRRRLSGEGTDRFAEGDPVLINPGSRTAPGSSASTATLSRRADRGPGRERLPKAGLALLRGGRCAPARLRDRLPDAGDQGTARRRRVDPRVGNRQRRGRPPPFRSPRRSGRARSSRPRATRNLSAHTSSAPTWWSTTAPAT